MMRNNESREGLAEVKRLLTPAGNAAMRPRHTLRKEGEGTDRAQVERQSKVELMYTPPHAATSAGA